MAGVTLSNATIKHVYNDTLRSINTVYATLYHQYNFGRQWVNIPSIKPGDDVIKEDNKLNDGQLQAWWNGRLATTVAIMLEHYISIDITQKTFKDKAGRKSLRAATPLYKQTRDLKKKLLKLMKATTNIRRRIKRKFKVVYSDSESDTDSD